MVVVGVDGAVRECRGYSAAVINCLHGAVLNMVQYMDGCAVKLGSQRAVHAESKRCSRMRKGAVITRVCSSACNRKECGAVVKSMVQFLFFLLLLQTTSLAE